jgi:hypothetical protein
VIGMQELMVPQNMKAWFTGLVSWSGVSPFGTSATNWPIVRAQDNR